MGRKTETKLQFFSQPDQLWGQLLLQVIHRTPQVFCKEISQSFTPGQLVHELLKPPGIAG
jgi:hypothetical protein